MCRVECTYRLLLAIALVCMKCRWQVVAADTGAEVYPLELVEPPHSIAVARRPEEHLRELPMSLQGLEPSIAGQIEYLAKQRYHNLNASSILPYDAFLQQEAVAAGTCSEMKDCLSCYNLSSWCHYCDDGACHSMASPYGCLSGTTCYNNIDCVRSTVEHVGVKPPSAGVVMGVLVLLFSTFACFGCSIMVCNAYTKSREHTISEPDPSYVEMDTMSASYRAPFLQSSNGYAVVNVTDDVDVEAPIIPRIGRIQKNIYAIRAATTCYIFCGVVAVGIVIVGAFAIAYAPAYPEMNVCNQELDWGSIVQGMSSLKLQADYEILTSVYNPNRASIVVHTADGVFSHSGVVVGRFEISDSVTLPGGSVTDILVTTSFTPSVWKSLELNVAYYQGDLILEADARSTASVLLTGLGGQSVYDFVYELKNYFIHVGGKSDRSWCNCPSWG